MVVIHHFLLAFLPALHTGNPAESHFNNTATESVIASSPLSLLYNGNFAVCIFFVLSGYVLSKSFFSQMQARPLYSLAVKRYPRLMMPIAVSSLLAFALMLHGYIIPWYKHCFTQSWWLCGLWQTDAGWWHFIKTTLINVPLKGSANYNTVLWTMEYEFKGSLLLAAFCFCIYRFPSRKIMLYALAFSLCCALREFYYLCFLAGIFFCDPLSSGITAGTRPLKLIAALLIAVFASYPAIEFYDFQRYWFSFLRIPFLSREEQMALWHAVAAIALLYLVLSSVRLQQLLSSKLLVYLGKISFSMYLLHVILIGAGCMHLLGKLPHFTNEEYQLSTLITFAAYLAVLFPLSHLFYLGVDKPAVRLSAWIAQKLVK